MLTLLILCAVSAADPIPRLVWTDVPADGVPLPPRLPPGLPAPIHVETPVAGTLLPTPRDTLLGELVDACTSPDRYPATVRTAVEQTAINVRGAEQVACAGRLAVERRQCQAADVRADVGESTGWPAWQVVLLSVGVGILAGAAGVGVGAILVR
jgi:hypothetical protein